MTYKRDRYISKNIFCQSTLRYRSNFWLWGVEESQFEHETLQDRWSSLAYLHRIEENTTTLGKNLGPTEINMGVSQQMRRPNNSGKSTKQ